MKEGNPILNTEDYIKKIEQTDMEISIEDVYQSVMRLCEPYENISTESENIEINIGEAKVFISYKPTLYTQNGETYRNNFAEEISQLLFKINDRSIDILKLIPANMKVVVYRKMNNASGAVITDENMKRSIVVDGDINSPLMLAILLHEIGHVIDYSKLDELGLEHLFTEHLNSDIAENIRKERVANAFVLKFLRPFLKNKQDRKDMINVLKHGSLAQYYKDARNQLKGRRQRSGKVSDSYYEWGDADYLL